MSEQVAIVTDPLAITIFDNTPTVTIVDYSSGEITVIDGTPRVTVSSNQPTRVIVSTGIGNAYDVDTIVNMLGQQVTETLLSVALSEDIDHIRDMWARLGNGLILQYQDGVDIQNASTLYTNTQISQTVTDLTVTMDGHVDLLQSNIDQTSGRIDLNVTSIEGHTDDFVVAFGRISITENDITSTVARLTTLDDPTTGVIQFMQSDIIQTASQVSINVTEISEHETGIIENTAQINITNTSISNFVTELDEVNGTLSTTVQELTATTATTTIQQTDIDGHGATLTAVESMMANKWGVDISETTGGVSYVTSMGLFLHPDWVNDNAYVIDDYVYFFDSGSGLVYKCILGHTSTTANNPVGVDGATYWVADTGKKSSFVIMAEEFKVITDFTDNETPISIFSVVDDVVTINGALVVQGPVTSSNYVSGSAGFKIDPDTNTAEFYGGLTISYNDLGGTNLPAPNSTADDLGQLVLISTSLAFNPDMTVVAADGRPAGLKAVYGSPVLSNISYQDAEKTIAKLYHAADASIGAGFPAFRINPGTTYKIRCRLKANIATGTGVYIRMYQLHSELPTGYTHISTNVSSSESGVIDSDTSVSLSEDGAITTAWVDYEFTYTPGSSAKWASLVILNWAGMSTNELHIDKIIITSDADNTSKNTSADTTLVSGEPAATVKNNAANAKIAVDAMEDNGVFDISEKIKWQIMWPGMLKNYNTIAGQGDDLEYDYSAFTTAKTNLLGFLESPYGTSADAYNAVPLTNSNLSDSSLTTYTEAFYEQMMIAVQAINKLRPLHETFVPHITWEYKDDVDGWSGLRMTVTQADDSAILTTTSADPQFFSPAAIDIDGSIYNIIRLRIMVTVSPSTWQGILYYSTEGHVIGSGYYKLIGPEPTLNTWSIIELDMSDLDDGDDDWITSIITRLRFDFCSDSLGGAVKVDWISVGKRGLPDSTQNAADNGIDTTTGGLIVRNSGSGDYAHLTAAALSFYYNNSGTMELLNSVKHYEQGTCDSGTLITLDGRFRVAPKVIVLPQNLPSWDLGFNDRDQAIYVGLEEGPTSIGSGQYTIKPVAQLRLGDSFHTESPGDFFTSSCIVDSYSNAYTPSAFTRKVRVLGSVIGAYFTGGSLYYVYQYIHLQTQYSSGGAWTTRASSPLIGGNYVIENKDYDIISATLPSDVYAWRIWKEYDHITYVEPKSGEFNLCTARIEVWETTQAGDSVPAEGTVFYFAIGQDQI